jgi:DNA-binding CsgD family transcriptional regulator
MPFAPSQIETMLHQIRASPSLHDLKALVAEATVAMGFTWFALVQHLHPRQWSEMAICLHNCEPDWPGNYAEQKLYRDDPIVLACAMSNVGFCWSELPAMLRLTPAHHRMLARYAAAGVGEGLTIPAHIAGEPIGSCSFAPRTGVEFPRASYLSGQVIGAFAFQAARRLAGLVRAMPPMHRPLTPRQRDCLIWAIRGKTDWEIGQILGLSPDTVTQHLDLARQRYGVGKRLQLAIQAIHSGDICLSEVV